MNAKDVVLIGTGPPMLFEGLGRARRGEKVTFIDSAPIIGGSWKCPSVMGHSGVEVGVHLIENRPHTNRILEALLEPTDLMVNPDDFGIWKGRQIPMHSARILLYAGIAGRNMLKGNPERVIHSLKNLKSAIGHRNLPFLYPKEGIQKLLTTIKEELGSLGATFRFNETIKSINITQGEVRLETTKCQMRADHLVMSSRAHAPIKGSEDLWEGVSTNTVTSAVCKISGAALKFTGYVELINDPVLKRVRNISDFVTPALPNNEALVTIQLRQNFDPKGTQSLLEHMIALKLVDESAQILNIEKDEATLNTLPITVIEKLTRKHRSKLTVLKTVDLGDQAYKL